MCCNGSYLAATPQIESMEPFVRTLSGSAGAFGFASPSTTCSRAGAGEQMLSFIQSSFALFSWNRTIRSDICLSSALRSPLAPHRCDKDIITPPRSGEKAFQWFLPCGNAANRIDGTIIPPFQRFAKVLREVIYLTRQSPVISGGTGRSIRCSRVGAMSASLPESLPNTAGSALICTSGTGLVECAVTT